MNHTRSQGDGKASAFLLKGTGSSMRQGKIISPAPIINVPKPRLNNLMAQPNPMGAAVRDSQPTSASQRHAKKIQFPNETKTSKLRAAKAAGSSSNVTEKYQGGGGRGTNADKVPPVPGQHMRQQSEKMPHLEAVDRLEGICATEPNDCSDDLRVFDFQDEEPNASDELLVDNLTPKATGVGRRKSYSNHFAFSGKDPAKGPAFGRQGTQGASGRTSLGSVQNPAKGPNQKPEARPFGASPAPSTFKPGFRGAANKGPAAARRQG